MNLDIRRAVSRRHVRPGRQPTVSFAKLGASNLSRFAVLHSPEISRSSVPTTLAPKRGAKSPDRVAPSLAWKNITEVELEVNKLGHSFTIGDVFVS